MATASYATEELIAEIGAAFLCADLGITPEIREDHAAYIAHWLIILKQDSHAFFRAGAQAQRAADYLKALQPKPAPDPADQSNQAETPQRPLIEGGPVKCVPTPD